MAVVRKKQDDKILKTLRELVSIGGNKECFDCGQKGPTYINMTIGSFVCTTCSGILRGITPPHRVKSISMATFTQEEIDFVRQNGNDECSRTWLGLWDPKRAIKQEHRDFMIDKYERKRYYLEPASPLKSLPTNGTTTSAASTLASATNGNGSSTNINGSSSNSSSSKNGAENLVPLKTITLTPPTSLRLSRTSSNSSGINGNGNSHTGSSTNLKFQQQFTPDDSNFFSDPPKILPPTPQKHSSNHHQRLNGTTNGSTFERNQKNGLLTSTSNGINPANKFTPDTDFVADFSNANIIVNAATTTTTATANGLKNGSNHRRLSNGFSENGNGLIPNGHRNGTNGNVSETENFADFEHNTIYNAAGLPISASTSSRSSSALSSATPSVDRYAALKDLDDQFREIKFESETNNNHIISSSSASAAGVNGLSNGLMNGNHHTNDVHQANPFKTANPFQQQAQQQQQQQQTLSWAIPGSTPPATNGFYATSSTSPYQNGFVHPGANMLNGNGITNGFTNAFHHHHQQQQHHVSSNGGIQATGVVPPYGHFGHFGNPFMAAGATTATSNSNNPFL